MPSLRLAELVALLALAQDNAFGQPLESQLRACVLASWLGAAAGHDAETRATTYWAALLRYVGCTGHAYEVAAVFGDEIAIRARTLVQDAADPAAVFGDAVEVAMAGRPDQSREQVAASLMAGVAEFVKINYTTGCEVGDAFARRLGFGPAVRDALRHTFERWNGAGHPSGSRGIAIPPAMRVVHLCHDMEAIARHAGPARALQAARDRRGRTYDPDLTDRFLSEGGSWFEQLDRLDPWDTVLGLDPDPTRTFADAELDEVLAVVADFVDLKSPTRSGRSRRCADLATAAAVALGSAPDAVTLVRRAALVQDLGLTAVSNAILDKRDPLTRGEREVFELHPVRTEQMLRRSPSLRQLAAIASAHHERIDGSGYPRGLRAGQVGDGGWLLVAANAYVEAIARGDSAEDPLDRAAAELGRLITAGELDRASADAVLAAAGHDPQQRSVRRGRVPPPGGLTQRELEVLRLAALGLTTREIGSRLFISTKTTDHHIQHVYTKIGVSTRGAAALWAMQHGVVG